MSPLVHRFYKLRVALRIEVDSGSGFKPEEQEGSQYGDSGPEAAQNDDWGDPE